MARSAPGIQDGMKLTADRKSLVPETPGQAGMAGGSLRLMIDLSRACGVPRVDLWRAEAALRGH